MNKNKKNKRKVHRDASVSRTTYDNGFKRLFSDAETCIRMYNEINTEGDKATVEDYTPLSMADAFAEGVVHDLAFLVKDHCMVLVEAQSIWNQNVIGRCALYACHATVGYFNNHRGLREQLFNSRLVHFPRLEIVVVNTSDKKTKEVFSLNETYFPGNPSAMDVTIRIMDDANALGILKEYTTFSRICREKFALFGHSLRAIKAVIEECKRLGIVVKLTQMGEKELMEMFAAIFSEEDYKAGVEMDKENAIKEAVAEAVAETEARDRRAFINQLLSKMTLPEVAALMDKTPEEIKAMAGQKD